MNIVQHNNEDIGLPCPIPLKQQPIREYWRLRQRRFFRWAILERSKYTTKLMAVWISALLLVLFVLVLRSPSQALSHSNFLMGAIIAETVVLLALFRLYSIWHYIHLRLISREIDYKTLATKETRFWQKSELVLARDILVDRFQIRPIIKRLKQSMMLLAMIISLNSLILFITTNY